MFALEQMTRWLFHTNDILLIYIIKTGLSSQVYPIMTTSALGDFFMLSSQNWMLRVLFSGHKTVGTFRSDWKTCITDFRNARGAWLSTCLLYTSYGVLRQFTKQHPLFVLFQATGCEDFLHRHGALLLSIVGKTNERAERTSINMYCRRLPVTP